MFCKKCGEENPDNAVFCRNCGERLHEEAKKAEIIDTPINNNQQQSTTQTESSKSDSTSWIACCCIGLFIIFILGAIFGGI